MSIPVIPVIIHLFISNRFHSGNLIMEPDLGSKSEKDKRTDKMDYKLVLVVPNLRWCKGDESTFWHFIPYNLCLLAAMVEDLCRVEIIDAYSDDLTESELLSVLKKAEPDVVGITVMMDQFADAGHLVCDLVKSWMPSVQVVMGGVYVTVNAETVIKDLNVDFAVIGEGEYVLRQLIGYFIGKNPLPDKGICFRKNDHIVNKGRADFIQDLDDLPRPAYHLIDLNRYNSRAQRKSVDSPRLYPYTRVFTSRGCPQRCIFCQVKHIAGVKFRYRSAENVLREIAWLKETYHVRSLIFDDDNLFTDKKRAKAIFSGMIQQGLSMPWVSISTAVFRLDEELIALMRKSGCEYMCIAIESGSERVLQEIIEKPVNYEHAKTMAAAARREGIFVAANFIIGFPTETWDEIRQTVKFAEEINVDYVKLFGAMPLRNTRLWDLCEKTDAFKKDFDYNALRWNTGQIETDDFNQNDLTLLRVYEWDRINFSTMEKRENIARMMGITVDDLLVIRRDSILNAQKSISGLA